MWLRGQAEVPARLEGTSAAHPPAFCCVLNGAQMDVVALPMGGEGIPCQPCGCWDPWGGKELFSRHEEAHCIGALGKADAVCMV